MKSRFYFVHSYYMRCNDEKIISATTNYNINFTSVVHYKIYMVVNFTQKIIKARNGITKKFYFMSNFVKRGLFLFIAKSKGL